MGIPDEDKLGTLCSQDMNKIETSAGHIRTAIQKVTDLVNGDTWTGSAADTWGTDFRGRMGALGRLFDSYPPEEQRLITKARKDQSDMDNKRIIGGS